jgi:zinc transport system permease protein
MGVRGAALATVLSQALSCFFVLLFLFGKRGHLRLRPRNFAPRPAVILPCVALGTATFIMQASESVISVCFNSSLLTHGGDVAVCAILALFVLFVFIFFYHKIFAVTFDESFATATGTKAEVYNTMLAIITGVVIVIAMNMVGALLITALITFPALSAMRIFKTFKKVIICAASIACSCALIGTVICIIASTPVGPTIAIANIVAFGIFYLVGTIKERVR